MIQLVGAAGLAVFPLLAAAMAIRALAGWMRMGELRFFGALMGGGIGAAGMAIAIVRLAMGGSLATLYDQGRITFIALVLAPIVEESLKGIVAMSLALTLSGPSFRLGFACGAIAGLAFAMTENTHYYFEGGKALSDLGLLKFTIERTIFTSIMHALGPAWIAGMLARSAPLPVRIGGAFAMVVGAMGLHFIWNALIIAEYQNGAPPFIARTMIVMLAAMSGIAFGYAKDAPAS